MKTRLLLALCVLATLFSCEVFEEEGVYIKVKNETGINLQQVVLEGMSYGMVNDLETTSYQLVANKVFRISGQADSEVGRLRIGCVRFCLTGVSALEDGYYTVRLTTIDAENHQLDFEID